MSDESDKSASTNRANDAATIADLRRQLHERDEELAKKQADLLNTTLSLKTVIGLKNRKELRSVIERQEETIPGLAEKSVVNQDENLAKIERLTQNLAISAADNATSGTIRARFTEISKLTSENLFSKASIKVNGMDWAIMIRQQTRDSTQQVAAFLAVSTRPVPESLSCTACYTIRLIRQMSKESAYASDSCVSAFTRENTSWGFHAFIKLEDLMSFLNHFVKNDAILMEIDFAVYS